MKYLGYVLALVLAFSLVLGRVSIEKEVYFEGEIVKITLENESPEFSLSIEAPSNAYRYLGNLGENIIFRPQEQGLYDVILYNMTDNNIIWAGGFTVIGHNAHNIIQSTEKIVALSSQNIEKKPVIKDSRDNAIKTRMEFYEGGFLKAAGNSLELGSLEPNRYDVKVFPDMKGVKSIQFRDLDYEGEFFLGIEDLPQTQIFVKAYAIDPTSLKFADALVTSIAQGNFLYKCAEWDFSEQRCLGAWVKMMALVKGEEYSFILTPDDPGYGESDEPLEPHPVKGFVYHADNFTRADNGIPVRIINNDKGISVLTQVYAPPIPLYKGAYSADIYGSDSDRITVRAWNSTHYGETNSTLGVSTTEVNVTMSFQRNSETNITILSPKNHTLQNIEETFNVTAKVEAIIADGSDCWATVSLSNSIANLSQSESYTVYIGNLVLGEPALISWNFTTTKEGFTNISVNSSCGSDGVLLENLSYYTVYNNTIKDLKAPIITIIYPYNNTETTNPVKISFTAYDISGLHNCSLYINASLNQTLFSPESNVEHTFNLTLQAAIYKWHITCFDNSSQKNSNLTGEYNFVLPSWHFYVGNLSSEILLSDNKSSKYSWEDQHTANIYVTETGSLISWSELTALGRDIYNQPSFYDFSQADVSLQMDEFTDSINSTYTYNNQPVKTASFMIFEQLVENIPIANSTNNSNFFTGILWDTSDGGTNYDGSQDLVFVTFKNQTLQGKYGVYDYEIRIPANLKNYKLGSGTVSFYVEIT